MNASKIIEETMKLYKMAGYDRPKISQEFNILKIGPIEIIVGSKESQIHWGNILLEKCATPDVPLRVFSHFSRLHNLTLKDFQDAIDFLPIREGHIHNYFHFETVVEYVRDLYQLKDKEYTKVNLAFDIARFGKQTRVRSRRFSRHNDVFVPESITDYRGHYAGYVDVFIPQANAKRPRSIKIGAADVFLLLFMKFVDDMKLLMLMAENLPLEVRDELLQTGLTEYTELFQSEKISDGKHKLTMYAFEPYETAEMIDVLTHTTNYVERMKREYRKEEELEEKSRLKRRKSFKTAKQTLEKRKQALEKKSKKRKKTKKEELSIDVLRQLRNMTLEELNADYFEEVILKQFPSITKEDFNLIRREKSE